LKSNFCPGHNLPHDFVLFYFIFFVAAPKGIESARACAIKAKCAQKTKFTNNKQKKSHLAGKYTKKRP